MILPPYFQDRLHHHRQPGRPCEILEEERGRGNWVCETLPQSSLYELNWNRNPAPPWLRLRFWPLSLLCVQLWSRASRWAQKEPCSAPSGTIRPWRCSTWSTSTWSTCWRWGESDTSKTQKMLIELFLFIKIFFFNMHLQSWSKTFLSFMLQPQTYNYLVEIMSLFLCYFDFTVIPFYSHIIMTSFLYWCDFLVSLQLLLNISLIWLFVVRLFFSYYFLVILQLFLWWRLNSRITMTLFLYYDFLSYDIFSCVILIFSQIITILFLYYYDFIVVTLIRPFSWILTALFS